MSFQLIKYIIFSSSSGEIISSRCRYKEILLFSNNLSFQRICRIVILLPSAWYPSAILLPPDPLCYPLPFVLGFHLRSKPFHVTSSREILTIPGLPRTRPSCYRPCPCRAWWGRTWGTQSQSGADRHLISETSVRDYIKFKWGREGEVGVREDVGFREL